MPADYRNPGQLPPGAVLVVGAGASGAQIAEELHARRPPRLSLGRPAPPPAAPLPRPRPDLVVRPLGVRSDDAGGTRAGPRGSRRSPAPMAATPSISAASPPTASRCWDASRPRATACSTSRPILPKTLPTAISSMRPSSTWPTTHATAPRPRSAAKTPTPGPSCRTRLASPSRSALDLAAEGIARGDLGHRLRRRFRLDRSVPSSTRTASRSSAAALPPCPGLYFLGLQWLSKMNSSFLSGVGDDAAVLADHIAARG